MFIIVKKQQIICLRVAAPHVCRPVNDIFYTFTNSRARESSARLRIRSFV